VGKIKSCTFSLITTIIFLCIFISQAYSSVILKSLVVNPSEKKTQKALLKAYLPKEATPQDILNLGDLKIAYDIEKGLYYVYKEFELAPKESVIRQIEIKDVWIISESELDAYNKRAEKLVDNLRGTNYFAEAISVQNEIEDKTTQILNKQAQAIDALPQTHIAVYRENRQTVDIIKDKLAKLEKLVVETRVTGAVPMKRLSVKASWWIIIGVIIALAILSFAFFIVWHRQAGVTALKQKEEGVLRSEEEPPLPPEADKQ
jgi:hypothetical protein